MPGCCPLPWPTHSAETPAWGSLNCSHSRSHPLYALSQSPYNIKPKLYTIIQKTAASAIITSPGHQTRLLRWLRHLREHYLERLVLLQEETLKEIHPIRLRSWRDGKDGCPHGFTDPSFPAQDTKNPLWVPWPWSLTGHGRTSPSRLQIAGAGAGYPEHYHQRVGCAQQPLLPPLADHLQAEDALEGL